MSWQGKAFGALIGVLAGGPVGALAGAFIGHLYDSQAHIRNTSPHVGNAGSARVQEEFFRATFQTMGHIAKADGRVSEQDIRAARAMMAELRLGEREVQLAIQLFTEGKAASFPLDATLRRLYGLCSQRPDLCRMFIQIQLQAALWSGSLNAAARQVLSRACRILEVSVFELVQMEALLRMQRASARTHTPQPAADRLKEAYAVLGLSHTATDADVKRAYRRLMNQNHPDKLHSKGLPESMMQMAQEKTRQIRAAYDLIRETRRRSRSSRSKDPA